FVCAIFVSLRGPGDRSDIKMSLDIYIDVSYHLRSQARIKRTGNLYAEIEPGSGGNPTAHHQGGSVGIPYEWNRWNGSFRSDGVRRPHSRRLLSPLRLQGSNCHRNVYRSHG